MSERITWPEHLERWAASRLSKKAYCLENNLSYAQFFYYQRKSGSPLSGTFHEVSIGPPQVDDHMEYHFSNGGCLVFPCEHLKLVLQIINP